MVCTRGGNRRTKYHVCPHCGKKKYYVAGNHLCGLFCKCQGCQAVDMRRAELDRLFEEEKDAFSRESNE